MDSRYRRASGVGMRLCVGVLALALAAGCMTGAGRRFSENLARAVAEQDDPRLVADALPPYILLIEGMLQDDPANEALLLAAASLYSAYAGMAGDDVERRLDLTEKAMGYAMRGVSVRHRKLPPLRRCRFDAFEKIVASLNRRDVPAWYVLGVTWAGSLRDRREDMTAAAELPRVELILKRVLELDETYRDGAAHMYVGAMVGLLPSELGGRPEEANRHFERAVELSGGRNLMARVMFAEHCARVTGDNGLYERVLEEVLEDEPRRRGYTLMNMLAQAQAERLLNMAGGRGLGTAPGSILKGDER